LPVEAGQFFGDSFRCGESEIGEDLQMVSRMAGRKQSFLILRKIKAEPKIGPAVKYFTEFVV